MKIKGIEQAIKRLSVDESKIKQALEQGGELILNQAKANVAIQGDDFQGLVQMEAKRDADGWTVSVFTDEKMGAYFEFGTGGFYVLPSEVDSAYTRRWYVNGKGTLHAAPWLFPAWRQNRDRVIELIKKSVSL